MKYLIAGLGNPGADYQNTRHNIGFTVVDAFLRDFNTSFETRRYAGISRVRIKNREFHLVKPITMMNLSGKAIRYWVNEFKIDLSRLLVITDDIALPAGTLRLRAKGGAGGHNGLQNIIEMLGTREFPRLRFGIGQDFPKGQQVSYVLSPWQEEEWETIQPKVKMATKIIKSFAFEGIAATMSQYNDN